MIESLIATVWENPRLAEALRATETQWLSKALNLQNPSLFGDTTMSPIQLPLVRRYVEAASILACSAVEDHRSAAYRLSTYCYDLYHTDIPELEAALRVVLTRLGNFPALETEAAVWGSMPKLPWPLASEEIIRRARNQTKLGPQNQIFTDFQKILWETISDDTSVAISAPTSAGKSFVLQSHLLAKALQRRSFNALYIVPTRALIAQVHEDLLNRAKNIPDLINLELLTLPPSPDEHLPSDAIYILTQERLQLLLDSYPAFRADFMVVDEAHSIQESDRGVLLQTVIERALERNPAMQLLFASPIVSNLDVFGKTFNLQEFRTLSTEQATVAQNFVSVVITNPRSGEVRLNSARRGVEHELGTARIGHTLNGRREALVHLAYRFGGDKQSLVFANGADDAEKIAFQLSELRRMEFEAQPAGDNVPTERQRALSDLAKEAVHPKYMLTRTALEGVAYHYGYMPTLLRRAIEQAFGAGDIHFLACTSTLLSGVNLPARNLFMNLPEKGSNIPLDSIDFWNLAGRAGRLKKEFQGNIFLIDYDQWRSKPLEGPRALAVEPAIRKNIFERLDSLIATITNDSFPQSLRSEPGLETTFVKLFLDATHSKLNQTLIKAGVGIDTDQALRISEAISLAQTTITLPTSIIELSPTISAHKQQALYLALQELASELKSESRLIPCHPHQPGAWRSYVEILGLCHTHLLTKPSTQKQNNFFATMMLKWMKGTSIPEIINGRQERYPSESIDTSIRKVLKLIEEELRFNYVRALNCYNSILTQVLIESGKSDLVEGLPPLALFMEVGACDRTMVSFIALGLSRVAASKLTEISPRKDFDLIAARNWLQKQDLELLGLSFFLREEVRLVLTQRAA